MHVKNHNCDALLKTICDVNAKSSNNKLSIPWLFYRNMYWSLLQHCLFFNQSIFKGCLVEIPSQKRGNIIVLHKMRALILKYYLWFLSWEFWNFWLKVSGCSFCKPHASKSTLCSNEKYKSMQFKCLFCILSKKNFASATVTTLSKTPLVLLSTFSFSSF